MNKPVIFLILLGAGFILWIAALIISKVFGKGPLKSYRTLAEKYELRLDENNKNFPVGSGVYRSTSVRIGAMPDGTAKNKEPLTFVEAECDNKDNVFFRIVKRTKPNINKYGNSGMPLADGEFDEKFIINTNNFPELLELMNFNAKYKLLQAVNLGADGELILNGNQIMYTEPGYIKGDTNIMKTEIMLHLICDIADDLKKIRPVTG